MKDFSRKDVRDAYRVFFDRAPENQAAVEHHYSQNDSLAKLLETLWNSAEFQVRLKKTTPVQVVPKSERTERLSLHDTCTGKYFLPADAFQDVIANTIIMGDIFDKHIYETAKRYIKHGTAVLDVGSNFGQMAVLFSRLVGDSGVVHAFEADDFVFRILNKNIAVNSCANIVAHFGAVHNIGGEMLRFPVQDFQSFGTYGSYGIDYTNSMAGDRFVKTITIDDLDLILPISFMKIDVQGGDLLVLKGAEKTIKKNRMAIIFEYESSLEDELGLNFQDYIDFVRFINYRFEKVFLGHNFLIVPSDYPKDSKK
jgi:FkbM family methyltransferase